MVNQPSRSATITTPSDREILITREFDAPARLVFEAATRPEHVRRWYGPIGMTLTVCEIDLRVGGAWRYVMQTPDGQEFGFHGVYREIVPGERTVNTEVFEGFPDVESVWTATYTEHGGKTTLTAHGLYPSVEARDGHLNSGMEEGMRQTHARLDALLAELQGDPALGK